jgi:hypothetical protein
VVIFEAIKTEIGWDERSWKYKKIDKMKFERGRANDISERN